MTIDLSRQRTARSSHSVLGQHLHSISCSAAHATGSLLSSAWSRTGGAAGAWASGASSVTTGAAAGGAVNRVLAAGWTFAVLPRVGMVLLTGTASAGGAPGTAGGGSGVDPARWAPSAAVIGGGSETGGDTGAALAGDVGGASAEVAAGAGIAFGCAAAACSTNGREGSYSGEMRMAPPAPARASRYLSVGIGAGVGRRIPLRCSRRVARVAIILNKSVSSGSYHAGPFQLRGRTGVVYGD